MASSPINDITGKKYGKLTVIAFAGIEPKIGSSWLCRCECGKEKVVRRCSLTNGHVKSCGCLAIAVRRTKSFRSFGSLRY